MAVPATVMLPVSIPAALILHTTGPVVKGSFGAKLRSGAQFATGPKYPDPDRVTTVPIGPEDGVARKVAPLIVNGADAEGNGAAVSVTVTR